MTYAYLMKSSTDSQGRPCLRLYVLLPKADVFVGISYKTMETLTFRDCLALHAYHVAFRSKSTLQQLMANQAACC